MMKITLDRKLIDNLLTMSDERLWRTLSIFASGAGIDMGRKKYDPERIARIRALLTAVTDEDLVRINALVDAYNSKR